MEILRNKKRLFLLAVLGTMGPGALAQTPTTWLEIYASEDVKKKVELNADTPSDKEVQEARKALRHSDVFQIMIKENILIHFCPGLDQNPKGPFNCMIVGLYESQSAFENLVQELDLAKRKADISKTKKSKKNPTLEPIQFKEFSTGNDFKLMESSLTPGEIKKLIDEDKKAKEEARLKAEEEKRALEAKAEEEKAKAEGQASSKKGLLESIP